MCAVALERAKNQKNQTRNERGRKECLQEKRFGAPNLRGFSGAKESFCLQKPFLTVRLIFGALKSDYTRAWSKSVPEITVVLVNVV
jgi:hypothetical protein